MKVQLRSPASIDTRLKTQDKIHIKSSGYIKPSSLAGLNDVNIVGVSDESLLWYNSTTGLWEVTDIIDGGTY